MEILICISFWESKDQSTLVMTFDPDILDNYTKLKGILQAASDANCRSLG